MRGRLRRNKYDAVTFRCLLHYVSAGLWGEGRKRLRRSEQDGQREKKLNNQTPGESSASSEKRGSSRVSRCWVGGHRGRPSALLVKGGKVSHTCLGNALTLILGFSRKEGRLGEYLARLLDGLVQERRDLRASPEDRSPANSRQL